MLLADPAACAQTPGLNPANPNQPGLASPPLPPRPAAPALPATGPRAQAHPRVLLLEAEAADRPVLRR